MVELVLAVSLAVCISAVCSLFEAVLYSVPLSTVEVMANKGTWSGRVFKRLRQNVQRPIGAILSLNTIANTAGAAVAGGAFIALYGHKWIFVFSAAFTLAILFFSEIIPKSIGVLYNKPLARFISLPLQIMVWGLYPLVWFVQLVTGFLAPKKKGGRISPQEIISLARLGRREGAIEFMEEKIIENILVLDEKKASDIMTPRTVIFSLSAEFTLEEARKEAGAWHHSRVPVYKDDPEDIVGFVMRRDVYNAIADGQKGKHLSELMRPIHFVPETARADVLFKDFLEKRQHQFVVIDEYGGVAGLVTLEDVLEEIIGREIVDEFDPAIDMAELARKRRKQVVGKTA